MTRRPELRKPRVPDIEDDEVRRDMLQTLMGLGTTIVRPRGRFTEPLLSDNRVWLAAGDHGGFTQRRAGTVVVGAPGAVVKGDVSITLTSEYHRMIIEGTVSLPVNRNLLFVDCTFNRALTVPASAIVRFINCEFATGAPSVAAGATAILESCYLTELLAVAATGKVHCIGCVFDRNSAINNAGVSGNAYVIGCSRPSGVAHTNATTIAETT